jgi:CheY-like chemotaxis protein
MVATPEYLVLIVEHDVWLRWTLRALFEKAEIEVVCASNGVAGLRRAIELQPSLIVLGAYLPELSAGELSDQLRALRIPFVTREEVLNGTQPQSTSTPARAGAHEPSERHSAVSTHAARRQHAPDLAIRR